MSLGSFRKRVVRVGLRQVAKLRRKLGFHRQFRQFATVSKALQRDLKVRWRDRYPILNEATATTEHLTHYLYFPAWAARKLREISPAQHVDISSYLHFATIVSAFIPTEFYDFRPADLRLSSLQMGRCDLNRLQFPDDSIPSLSCMHVVEHIGLGRYGDPLDPEGDLKAVRELTRVLAPGGTLLFVAPMGRPRVQFNAHRIYSYRQVVDFFASLKILEFSLIPDDEAVTGMIPNAPEALCDQQSLGCGCFVFQKPLKASERSPHA